jgi:hypothetical protein
MRPAAREVLRLGRRAAAALGCIAWLAAAACATLPPARPIDSLDSLAGTWAGVADLDRRFIPWRVTIAHDGRLVMEYADVTLWGSVTLRDGRATYTAGHTSGELTLHGEGYQRVLEMRDSFGTLRVQMRPV